MESREIDMDGDDFIRFVNHLGNVVTYARLGNYVSAGASLERAYIALYEGVWEPHDGAEWWRGNDLWCALQRAMLQVQRWALHRPPIEVSVESKYGAISTEELMRAVKTMTELSGEPPGLPEHMRAARPETAYPFYPRGPMRPVHLPPEGMGWPDIEDIRLSEEVLKSKTELDHKPRKPFRHPKSMLDTIRDLECSIDVVRIYSGIMPLHADSALDKDNALLATIVVGEPYEVEESGFPTFALLFSRGTTMAMLPFKELGVDLWDWKHRRMMPPLPPIKLTLSSD